LIKKKNYHLQIVITALILLSIILVAFLTYSDILGYFFTATDSLSLIDSSRIKSIKDVGRILTEPLMNGTEFARDWKYYRPLTTLSFSLDYSVWKLNPFGYHLTNLILHVIVSVLVFFLVRFLTKGKLFPAWLSSIIFTSHPILVENVPGTARRQDILAALFLLISLLLFFKHLSGASLKRRFLFFSIFFYALSLGAKEIAIILPFLIFAYLMIFPSFIKKPFKTRMIYSLKLSSSYFIVTLIIIVWRIFILKGIGGSINGLLEGSETIQSFANIFNLYFLDLVYPVDFLSSLFSSLPGIFIKISLQIAFFFLFIFVLFFKRNILKIVGHSERKEIKALKIFFISLLTLLLIGILASSFFDSAKFFISSLCSFLLIVSAICLIGIHQRRKIESLVIHSAQGKLVFFLTIWILLPLIIYLTALNFSHRNMYLSVIPFSALLSVILVEKYKSLKQNIKVKKNRPFTSFYHLSLAKTQVISLAVIAGLLFSLLAYSPLIRKYGEWKDCGIVCSMFLNKLSEITAELPNDADIHVYNLIKGFSQYDLKLPHAKDVTYLGNYSIKSWLDLNHPANNMKIHIESKLTSVTLPKDLDLKIERKEGDPNKIKIIIKKIF